jgi:phosphoribosylglycinamide formyltransferase-1
VIQLGIISSSGGAVFESAFHILRGVGYDVRVAVVTDRACGIEMICANLKIPFLRIEDPRIEEFSAKAAQWLYDVQYVDWTALFFTRLVAKVLYSRAPCINFHPSLLPAFPGLGAINCALSSGAKFFGATAHLVDHSIDNGPILAQVIAPIAKNASLDNLGRISFAQKLYLLLVICEALNMERADGVVGWMDRESAEANNYANPKLADSNLEKAFIQFVRAEGILWPE